MRLVMLCLFVWSCRSTPVRPDDHQPVRPAQIIGTVAAASIVDVTNGWASYLNAAFPGAGAAITPAVVQNAFGELVGVRDLSSVNWEAPMLLVAQTHASAQPTFVLGVMPRDKAALTAAAGERAVFSTDGAAWLGAPSDANATSSWGMVARRAAPQAATLTLYTSALQAAYADDIAAGLQSMRDTLQTTQPGAGELFVTLHRWWRDEVSELAIAFPATEREASLQFTMVAAPNTRFAQFCAAQAPSDFAMAKRLPELSGEVFMLGAGRIALGPYADSYRDFLRTVAPSMATMVELFGTTFDGAMHTSAAGTVSIYAGAPQRDMLAKIAAQMTAQPTQDIMGMRVTIRAVQHAPLADRDVLQYEQQTTTTTPSAAPLSSWMQALTHQHVAIFHDKAAWYMLSRPVTATGDKATWIRRVATPASAPSAAWRDLIARGQHDKQLFVMEADYGSMFASILGASSAAASNARAPLQMSVGATKTQTTLAITVPVASAKRMLDLVMAPRR